MNFVRLFFRLIVFTFVFSSMAKLLGYDSVMLGLLITILVYITKEQEND